MLQHDEQEELKELRADKEIGENRLTKSEHVKSKSSKSTTYYNYLNNRMSVRINVNGKDRPQP